MTVATMDDDVFREFRKFGFSEEIAAIMAKIASRRDDEFVTRADREAERESEREAARAERKTERETERDAARAVRDAERAADREAFADKGDVTVLQAKAKTVEDAIISIDKRFERIDKRFERVDEQFKQIDERFNGVDKSLARLDERMNGLQSQNDKFFYIFFSLHIVTITGLIALLTKGSLWGVVP